MGTTPSTPDLPRSRMRHLALVGAALAVGLLTACGSTDPSPGSGDGSPTGAPTSSGPTGGTPAPAPPTATPPAGSVPPDLREQPRVSAAIADAAARAGVDPAGVVVAAATAVTWNDGSLGCPQKGMAYTQAEVEGELLLLRVGTALMSYHARVDGPFTYCASPSAGYAVRS